MENNWLAALAAIGVSIEEFQQAVYARCPEDGKYDAGEIIGELELSLTRLMRQNPQMFPNRNHFFAYVLTSVKHLLIRQSQRADRQLQFDPEFFEDVICKRSQYDGPSLSDMLEALAPLPKVREVAKLLSDGFEVREIAENLGVSVSTVYRLRDKAGELLSHRFSELTGPSR